MSTRRPRPRRWTRTAALALLVLAAAWSVGPAQGQEVDVLDVAEIESRLAGLEGVELPEGVKPAAQGSYREALGELKRATQLAGRAVEFRQRAEEAKKQLEALRARPPGEKTVKIKPPAGATVEDLEASSARAEEALSLARAKVEQIQAEGAQRTSRGAELTELLARLTRDERGLKTAIQAEGPTALLEAQEIARRAKLKAVQAEIEATKAEQANLAERRELLPEALSAAKLEAERATNRREQWQAAVAAQRSADAVARAEEAHRLEREALQSPLIKGQASQLSRYTELDAQLTTELTQAEARLTLLRTHLNELRSSFRTVRRKVDAAGVTEAMGFVLRNRLKNLEDLVELERAHTRLQTRISEVQFDLITLEESRNSLIEPSTELRTLLEQLPTDSKVGRELLGEVGLQVLKGRQRFLDSAIKAASGLFTRLVELDELLSEQLKANKEYRSYIEERILWVPSVAGGGIPNPTQAGEALTWLVAAQAWHLVYEQLRRRERWLATGGLLLLWILSLILALAAHRQLRIEQGLEISAEDRIRPAIRAALFSAARALPLPVGLGLVGFLLRLPAEEVPLSEAVGKGLQAAALLWLGLALTRSLLHPQGMAGLHLRWPQAALRYVRRNLLWLIVIKVTATFFVVALDDQPGQDNTYGDSLGRFAFVCGEIALTLFSALVFRPGGPVVGEFLRAHADGWLSRLRYVWYIAAVGTPLTLAILALRGFYFTATSLDESLKESLGLVLGVMFLGGLLGLWIEGARAHRARTQAEAAKAREDALRRSQVEGFPGEEELDDHYEEDELERQVRELFRVGAGVCVLVGLFAIWGGVLPALKRLDRIQLWPRIQVLEQSEKQVHYPTLEGTQGGRKSGVSPAPTPAPGAKPSEGETPALPGPGLPNDGASSGKSVPDTLPARVTLADLGLAILLLFFTIAATRSLPALLELVLLPRLPLDAGARYAVATVARYMIIFLGVSAGATAVGIGWENLQWLAAALTFGLAFGLQEIFANFVSGLIILFERPVRVGDQITIGEVTGVVTRLRMRATTIRQLDDRELIVPNREFVTGQVVNWSLSDATLRVSINVGVAYGSDVNLVRRLLLQSARRDRQVLRKPRPQALFVCFGASSLDFILHFWVAHPTHRWECIDRLHRAIDAAFRTEKVEISFPQHDLHIRNIAPLTDLANAIAGRTVGLPPAAPTPPASPPVGGLPTPRPAPRSSLWASQIPPPRSNALEQETIDPSYAASTRMRVGPTPRPSALAAEPAPTVTIPGPQATPGGTSAIGVRSAPATAATPTAATPTAGAPASAGTSPPAGAGPTPPATGAATAGAAAPAFESSTSDDKRPAAAALGRPAAPDPSSSDRLIGSGDEASSEDDGSGERSSLPIDDASDEFEVGSPYAHDSRALPAVDEDDHVEKVDDDDDDDDDDTAGREGEAEDPEVRPSSDAERGGDAPEKH